MPGFTTAFGSLVGPVADDNLFTGHFLDYYKQKAVFGELSVYPIDRLTLTGGVRWFKLSRLDSTEFSAAGTAGAPIITTNATS